MSLPTQLNKCVCGLVYPGLEGPPTHHCHVARQKVIELVEWAARQGFRRGVVEVKMSGAQDPPTKEEETVKAIVMKIEAELNQ